MTTTERIVTAEIADAGLVAESLAGDREAFRQIVERHKSLVCSLAYCATGSLTQSEDLAQETFIAAWKRLSELREPAKLRPWLCGIARNVICNDFRRQGREPVHDAETLETIDEFAGTEPLPSERAIGREEEAILWHCVARIPAIYREPLVMFYRENESIARVAEALELTEDAVKQRLSRGRKLLQEQTLAYVEGALRSTNPGPAFAVGVLAALSISSASASGVTFGAAVKGSSTAKTIAGFAAVGAIVLYWSLLGFLAFAGVCAGYWMSRSCAKSSRQCENAIRFWRTLAWGFAGCFGTCQLLSTLCWPRGPGHYLGWIVWMLFLDSFYIVIVAALAIWIRDWWRECSVRENEPGEVSIALKRRFVVWLSLGVIGPACLAVPIVGGVLWQTFHPAQARYLSTPEIRGIVADPMRVSFWVDEAEGKKSLYVYLPENNPYGAYWRSAHMFGWWRRWTSGTKPAPWNFWNSGTVPIWWVELIGWTGWRPDQTWAANTESAVRLLNEKGIHYGTSTRPPYRETLPFGSLLPYFITPMAAVILLRQFRKDRWPKTVRGNSNNPGRADKYSGMFLALRDDPGARRVFRVVFAMAFLLAFLANALTAWLPFNSFGLYIILVLGSLKSAFFGLLAGVGVLYFRLRRNALRAVIKH